MKILYLKDCKWLLSQNQRVRTDFFRYKLHQALAKYIKLFIKKGRQCPDKKLCWNKETETGKKVRTD